MKKSVNENKLFQKRHSALNQPIDVAYRYTGSRKSAANMYSKYLCVIYL